MSITPESYLADLSDAADKADSHPFLVTAEQRAEVRGTLNYLNDMVTPGRNIVVNAIVDEANRLLAQAAMPGPVDKIEEAMVSMQFYLEGDLGALAQLKADLAKLKPAERMFYRDAAEALDTLAGKLFRVCFEVFLATQGGDYP